MQSHAAIANALRELEAGEARHFDVRDDDVGFVALGECPRLFAIGRAADHVEIRFELEQRRQRTTHHRLIFGEQNADHRGERKSIIRAR